MRDVFVIMEDTKNCVEVLRDIEPYLESLTCLGLKVQNWVGRKRHVRNPSGDIVATIYKAGMGL